MSGENEWPGWAYGCVEGQLATGEILVVEGKVWRGYNGRAWKITDVTNAEIRQPGHPDDYKRARGAVKAAEGAPSPEETIRRLRDTE